MKLIRQAYAAIETRAIDETKGIYSGVISTETPGRRFGDVLISTGGKLENFLNNPVVPFAHSTWTLPVARALSLTVEPGRILATWEFAPRGLDDFADKVHDFWRLRFINGLSIGAIVEESEPLDPKNKSPWAPERFTVWEMVEFSIVPIPMLPDTLRVDNRLQLNALPGVYPTRFASEEVIQSAANNQELDAALTAILSQLRQLREG